MRSKREKREKSKFKKFLIVYSIILAILMIIFLIYVANSLILYEDNQTDNYISKEIENLKEMCKKGKVDKYIDLSGIKKGEFEKQETTVEQALEEILNTQEITYKLKRESSEEKPIYEVYVNDKLIFEIELNGAEKEHRLGLLTFSKWKTEAITSKIDNEIFTYNILVPNNYKVYVNGKELTEDQIEEKVQNEGLAQISKYIEIPYIVKYKIENVLKQPEVKILDKNGNNVEFNIEKNTIKKDIEFKKIENEQEALKQIKNAPEILKTAENWSLFLTDDLSGTLHGYYNINKNFIKDSDISKYAYKWATGIDITFISSHILQKPIFTNERVENFEIYNENAFSCEVYLEKNMLVKSQKMQDKMHEKMYWVYYEKDSQWKLVNMQSITEAK